MKYGLNSLLMIALMIGCRGFGSAPITYYFDNQTNEEVPLGVVLKDSKGLKNRTINLAPGQKEQVVFEGCLEQIIVPVPAELAMRGQGFKTKFKPSSKYRCKSITTSIYTKDDGAFDVNFVYQ